MKTKGLIQIYTGDGKGKTTASVGLACRARGHNLKVCYICFHKDPKRWQYGEHGILKKIGVKLYGFAKEHPHFCKEISSEDIRYCCLKGLQFIRKIYKQNKYDMLILDEINICLRDGFLKEEEILKILDAKPRNLELILTGRGVSKNIIKKADLVSCIRKIKHPFDLGIERRKGIEY